MMKLRLVAKAWGQVSSNYDMEAEYRTVDIELTTEQFDRLWPTKNYRFDIVGAEWLEDKSAQEGEGKEGEDVDDQ